MGDVASNIGGPWLHTDPAGNVIDVRVGGYHHTPTTGAAWIAPPPLTPTIYSVVYAAAWTGATTFAATIATTVWATWYAALSVPDREAFRWLVLARVPADKVGPPP
jgi:hypothetical protein